MKKWHPFIWVGCLVIGLLGGRYLIPKDRVTFELGSMDDLGRKYKPLKLTDGALASMSTQKLVQSLLDGNPHVKNNNRIVKKLVEKENESIPLLIEAIKDETFPGRGYSAWALAEVLERNKIKNDDALTALVFALGDDYQYLQMLSASGLDLVKDRRTIYGLISNFDLTIGNFPRALITLTGKSFLSKDKALEWWEKHKSEYPEQIIVD